MPTLNLFDLVASARRHWKGVLVWSASLAVFGYLVSFAIPPAYRATAVILPPEEDELASSISLAQRGFAGLGLMGRFGAYFTPADVALAILRSRSVHERVVDETNYASVYKQKSREQAYKRLASKVSSSIANDGTISVTAEDRSAERAATIANLFVEHLDDYNRQFRSFRARRTRVFLEERVALVDSALSATEAALAKYQREKGTVVLPPETGGAADAAIDLMSRLMTAEVELELLRSYASPQDEELVRAESRIRELRKQVGDVPGIQIGGASLIRQAVVYQQVFAFLTAQLEQARIREAMDTPTIQVLDPAQRPEKRFWPRRLWISAFGAFVGLVLASLQISGKLKPLEFGRSH